jgi:hypothetical protein
VNLGSLSAVFADWETILGEDWVNYDNWNTSTSMPRLEGIWRRLCTAHGFTLP